jgi:DnaJ-class molecular chaperone
MFYVEQVLLSPDSDKYRILGGSPSASNAELRHNMALLQSWLHPDRNPLGERSVLAMRVADAWSTLRTPEGRADYDASLEMAGKRREGLSEKLPAHDPSHSAKSLSTNTVSFAHQARRRRVPHGSSFFDRCLIYLRRVFIDRFSS